MLFNVGVPEGNRSGTTDATSGGTHNCWPAGQSVGGRDAAQVRDEGKARRNERLIKSGEHDRRTITVVLEAGRGKSRAGTPIHGVISLRGSVDPLK